MGVAHQGRAGAAREATVAVADDECLPDRCGGKSLVAADVEDLRARAEHDRDQVGVAGHPAGRFGREELPGLGGREAFPRTRSSYSMVMATRGVAPCQSGSTSAVSSRRQDSTRASSMRAPWSRGSRPSWAQPGSSQVCGSQPGTEAGCGLDNGSRVALIRAASSAEQRPLRNAPPARSSVIVRCRLEVGGSFLARQLLLGPAFLRSRGPRPPPRWRATLRSTVASSRLASPSRKVTPRVRRSGSSGSGRRAMDDVGLGGREPPVVHRLRDRHEHGLDRAGGQAHHCRTRALVPAREPVTKSCVEARLIRVASPRASISRTTSSMTASSSDITVSIPAAVSFSSPASRAANRVSRSSETSRPASRSTSGAPRSPTPGTGPMAVVGCSWN